MKVNNGILLGIGNISLNNVLGKYYQDFTPALRHIENEEYVKLDKIGLPYHLINQEIVYSPVLIIQYGLICHDLLLNGIDKQKNNDIINKCLKWLITNKENHKGSIVWRNKANIQYNLPAGWVSSMYQGQAISLFLRAYQLYNKEEYLTISKNIFSYFNYNIENGGVKRTDKEGYTWFEEYPTKNGSYVLNGFIYTLFGLLDFYRVTNNDESKILYDSCMKTLKENIHKYDVWYWSIYDQEKRQLVSYYYQKNIHIPLMKILFVLSKEDIFNHYAIKWDKSLNSIWHNAIVKIMYRIKPRFNF